MADDRIAQAFDAFPRELFLPGSAKQSAGIDAPIPIGFNQTNSQPSTVRRMLEWLAVQPGNRVLDIGSGSGWTTALLSYLAGQSGHVVAVERIPALVDMGRENCKKAHVQNAGFHQAREGIFGWPEGAPYDRILVSAAADELPEELLGQLKEGGKMEVPVRTSIWVIEKQNRGVRKTEHPGFYFVPLLP